MAYSKFLRTDMLILRELLLYNILQYAAQSHFLFVVRLLDSSVLVPLVNDVSTIELAVQY